MKVLFFLVCLLPLVFVRAEDDKRFIVSNIKSIVKNLVSSGAGQAACVNGCDKIAGAIKFLCGPTCEEVIKELGR